MARVQRERKMYSAIIRASAPTRAERRREKIIQFTYFTTTTKRLLPLCHYIGLEPLLSMRSHI